VILSFPKFKNGDDVKSLKILEAVFSWDVFGFLRQMIGTEDGKVRSPSLRTLVCVASSLIFSLIFYPLPKSPRTSSSGTPLPDQ
jgi:hypothetical protein